MRKEINNETYTVTYINKSKISKLTKVAITCSLAGIITISSVTMSQMFNLIGNKQKEDDILKNRVSAIKNNNDAIIENIVKNGILIANDTFTSLSNYFIKNSYLYDQYNNLVTFEKETKPIYMINCNVNNNFLANCKLNESKIKQLSLEITSIEDGFISYLPSTIKSLSLNKSNYITNLNDLPKVCPNIEYLYLNNMPMLSDLSFIYEMPRLKEVYIAESAYITEDILKYLNDNDIKTNISYQDVINSKKTDEIVQRIIKPNMTDTEKINAISSYVIDNLEYDAAMLYESNMSPLSLALNENKGVCSSYAYLTNVLLNKANINSINLINDEHSWNLLEIDDEYYYLDTTNIDISNSFIRAINKPGYYMANPIDSKLPNILDNKIIIPKSVVDDIINNYDIYDLHVKYKNIKYGTLAIASVIAGIVVNLKIKSKKEKQSKTR